MNNELKPCPFCGGDAEIRNLVRDCLPPLYIAGCHNVDCYIRPNTECNENELCCIKAWNRRAYQPDEIEAEFLKMCEAQMEHDPLGKENDDGKNTNIA